MSGRRRPGLAAAALLLASALSGPVAAQSAALPPAETLKPTTEAPLAVLPPVKMYPPKDPAAGGVLDVYSRYMFAMNKAVYGKIDQLSAWWQGPQAAAKPAATASGGGSLTNVVANLVNEPVTAIAALAVGDFGNSWRSVERFGINSTIGVLGYYDTATSWGFRPAHTDAGLSLCRAGVGEGGYVVLPFVGPRTVRDAVADVVLTNAVLWVAAGSLFGTGATLQTIAIAETVEIVADVVATRQIDPQAKAIGFTDYATTRDRYLAQRRARCAALRGDPAPPRKMG
ncbi:MlaA family lipoprotein [Azospirillum cavernae]|nr:MlaA family lipoprotein [Azospirillum cavernae]